MRRSGRPDIAAAALALALAAGTSGVPRPAPRTAPASRVVPAVAVPGCSAATGTGRRRLGRHTLLVTDFDSQRPGTVNVTNLP